MRQGQGGVEFHIIWSVANVGDMNTTLNEKETKRKIAEIFLLHTESKFINISPVET